MPSLLVLQAIYNFVPRKYTKWKRRILLKDVDACVVVPVVVVPIVSTFLSLVTHHRRGSCLILLFRVTQTTVKDSHEFVLHVPSQYDYRYLRSIVAVPATGVFDSEFWPCSIHSSILPFDIDFHLRSMDREKLLTCLLQVYSSATHKRVRCGFVL